MLVWLLKTVLKLVRHSLVLSWLLFLSTLIALLIYHLFYQWYMPKARIEKNIEFELKTAVIYPRQQAYPHPHAAYHHHANRDVSSLAPPPPPPPSSYYHYTSELVANVNLFDRQGDSLHSGQEYSLALIMDVPESDWNFDIGMFGVTVDIVDLEGRKIITYKTMGTLIYKSTLLRFLSTLVNFPWYLIGRFEQKQTISLMLKENFIDNAYMPANKIVIRISEKLQYYTALLIIEAKFAGFKYYLNRWYYTLSFIICLGLTFITFIVLLSSCFDLKSMFISKENNKRLPNSQLVPYKKLAYPYDFDFERSDNGDMETNSNVSSRSMFEETGTEDNESSVSKEDTAVTNSGGSGFSLRNTYSFLRRLNRKTLTDWSYF